MDSLSFSQPFDPHKVWGRWRAAASRAAAQAEGGGEALDRWVGGMDGGWVVDGWVVGWLGRCVAWVWTLASAGQPATYR